MPSSKAKALTKAIEVLESLQDDIAYHLASGSSTVDAYSLLEKLAKVHNLIDRSYPEDVHDDGHYQHELDFGDDSGEEPFTHAGFDHEESEEEER